MISNISHSVGGLFILWVASCSLQKLFRLIRSYLFILAFLSLAFGIRPKKEITKTYATELIAYVLF